MKKKLTAIVLIVIMIMTAACSGRSGDNEENDEPGRYVQEERSLPEDVGYVQGMKMLDNGVLRLAGESSFYDSADGGQSWEQVDIDSAALQEIDENDAAYMAAVAMKADGTLFFLSIRYLNEDYMESENYEAENKYILIDPDGNEQEITLDVPEATDESWWEEESDVISAEDDIDDADEVAEEEGTAAAEIEEERVLYNVALLDDGTLLGNDWGEVLYQFNLESGELIREYHAADMDSIETFAVINDQLLMKSWNEAVMYDLESGEQTAMPAGLEEFLAAERNSSSSDDYQFFYDETGDILYVFFKPDGVYRLRDGGAAEAELLLDGSSYSLTNPEVYIQNMVLLEDETFLADYSRDESSGLYYYSYSETATGPQLELSIVSLQEDSEIQQAAASFQEQNPQYSVKYEYLMDYDTSLSLTETLKTLNTEILAGNGPDVLILDNMPVDTYIEMGVLEDLTDVMDELRQEGNYFDNILTAYATDDGLYGIPTRFTVPMMMGSDEDLARITDLTSLAEYTEEKRQENENYENIIGDHGASISSLLLQVSVNSIVKTDGTIDEAALREFITQTETIYRNDSIRSYQAEEATESDYDMVEVDDFYYLYESYVDLTGMGVLYAINDMEPLLTGLITDITEINEMFGIREELGWNWAALPGMDTGVYNPVSSIGVNAQAEHTEEAKEFVAFLLSAERQQTGARYGGIPVSIDAYDAFCEKYLSGEEEAGSHGYGSELYDGTPLDGEIDGVIGTSEDYEAIRELFAGLDTPVLNNTTVVTAIRSGLEQCLEGGASIDETTEAIMQKINLYLSE